MTTLYARVTSKSPVAGPEPGDVLGYQITLGPDSDAGNDWVPEGTTASFSASFIATPEVAEGWPNGAQVALELTDVTPELLRERDDASEPEDVGTLSETGSAPGSEATPEAPEPVTPADAEPQATAKTRK